MSEAEAVLEDESDPGTSNGSRVRFWRLFWGVFALVAAVLVGRWLGVGLAGWTQSGADHLHDLSPDPGADSWADALFRNLLNIGIRFFGLAEIALPVLSLSIVLAFWTTTVNALTDLGEFARGRTWHWPKLLKPVTGVAAAAFTIGAVAHSAEQRKPLPEISVLFVPALHALSGGSGSAPVSYVAQIPVVYFSSGQLRAGKLTERGSELAEAYAADLREFIAIFADCANDPTNPVELEVAGFANQKPFRESGRRYSELEQRSFNAEQANRRAEAVLAELERQSAGLQIRIKASNWEAADDVPARASEAFTWIAANVDERHDFLRAAIVTVKRLGSCGAPRSVVASRAH